MSQKLTTTEIKYLRIYAKKHILLPTKYKKPLVKGWNEYYAEHRTIEQLLTLNKEYSLRTGLKVIRDYYFIALDLDDLWAKERIKTNWLIETNKGIHRYILIKELPKSCWLVDEKGKKIGELHSKGRFVVGIGSIHEQGTRYSLRGKVNQKWSWKLQSLAELQEFLKLRNIFTTPWGKKGLEEMKDLQFYTYQTPKVPALNPLKTILVSKSQINKTQKYSRQKEKLEKRVSNHQQKAKLNICYLCLVYFEKQAQIIKTHLQGKKHQKQLRIWPKKCEQTEKERKNCEKKQLIEQW